MPRSRASEDMSPNGSITTFAPSAVRVNADWPCHSTRMLFLQSLDLWVRRRLVGVVVAAAAEQGGAGCDQAGHDRERERGGEAVAERAGDQVREEGVTGERGVLRRRHRVER